MTTVVLPEAFAASHFADPTYHLNTELFLLGIHDNGIMLVDAEDRLRNELCDYADKLASIPEGVRSHILLTDMMQPGKQNAGTFVRTRCSFPHSQHADDVAVSVAIRCKVDALLVDPANRSRLASRVPNVTEVVSVPEYFGSATESKRRSYCQSLPSIDHMSKAEFDRIIVGATRFSRWLRFYDKQIGKGNGPARFRRGLERILRIWTENAYFPREELSVELFTVADETGFNKKPPLEAFEIVRDDIIDPLQKQFDIPITLRFKRDTKWKDDSICHARHLETESMAINFEKGFDFLKFDKSHSRTTITPVRGYVSNLSEYRSLEDFPVNT